MIISQFYENNNNFSLNQFFQAFPALSSVCKKHKLKKAYGGLFLTPFDFAFQTGKRFEKRALRQNQTPAKQAFKSIVSGAARTRKLMPA